MKHRMPHPWLLGLCAWLVAGPLVRPARCAEGPPAAPVPGATAAAVAASATGRAETVRSIFDRVVEDYGEGAPGAASGASGTNGSPQDRTLWQSFGEMLISLALVILLVLAFAWMMKRYVVKDKTLGGGYIRLLASYAVSPKAKVHLIQVGGEMFLVGEGGSALSLISKVDIGGDGGPEDGPAGPPPRAPAGDSAFDEKLAQWRRAMGEGNVQDEVRTSLLLLGGLTQRLRNKRGGGDGDG